MRINTREVGLQVEHPKWRITIISMFAAAAVAISLSAPTPFICISIATTTIVTTTTATTPLLVILPLVLVFMMVTVMTMFKAATSGIDLKLGLTSETSSPLAHLCLHMGVGSQTLQYGADQPNLRQAS